MAGSLEFSQQIVDFLQGRQCVVLATASPQGQLHTAIMTWVVAKDSRTIRIALDKKGRPLSHIRNNENVALEILGDDINIGVVGKARVIEEQMDSVSFPCAAVEIKIGEVIDHGFSDIRFKGPSYSFVPGKEEYSKVEDDVFAELLKT
jgi:hypothetical protein